ncbi:MAG: hypothetical protein ACJAT4_001189 [Granulosicoccus sp.]|jgi:hypothetical protein
MEFIISFILSLEFLFGIFVMIALVYLLGKRIEDKEYETFEDRDN